MAVSVETGPSFQFDVPQPLFELRTSPSVFAMQYDVTEDGQRFLVNEDETADVSSLGLFLNWPAILEE